MGKFRILKACFIFQIQFLFRKFISQNLYGNIINSERNKERSWGKKNMKNFTSEYLAHNKKKQSTCLPGYDRSVKKEHPFC